MLLKNALERRLKNVRDELNKKDIDAYLFEDSSDLLYLTGLEFSRGLLCMTKNQAVICVDGRYLHSAGKQNLFSVVDITQEETYDFLRKDVLQDAATLGFDPCKTTITRYKELKKKFSILKEKDNPLTLLRQVKDAYELKCLQKSANILIEAMQWTQTKLTEGMTERELSYIFESKALELGADRMSFRPIVAFGKNAAMPHYKTGDSCLKNNSLVLIDAGVVVSSYASDMTRVFFLNKAKAKDQKIYMACHKALQAVLHEVRAGVLIKDLDRKARDLLKKEGFGDIPHSLGHGIGLEVHEKPILSAKAKTDRLKENMVVTIEPGIYLPNVSGVRLEEMILVTKTGYKNFYKKYPIMIQCA